MSLPRDAIESLSGAPRARTPFMGVAVPAACCVWRVAAVPRHDEGGGGRVSPRPQASTFSRAPAAAARAGGPVNSHRRRAWLSTQGAPSAMHQTNETLALNPTSAGSAISSTVLSFRAKGAIFPNQGAAARLPRYLYARVARALRPRTCFGLADCGSPGTATSRAGPLLGWRRAHGLRGALGGGFFPGWGAARVTRASAARTPGGPGDRRMHSAPRASDPHGL